MITRLWLCVFLVVLPARMEGVVASVAKAPGWYPGDPGSNPGDPPLGRGKRATGIDGSVKVDSTARTLTERMGTISKPP